MIRGAFNDMLTYMQDYALKKAAHVKKLESIDAMVEYSEWKKDQLCAEQRDAFNVQKEQLLEKFAKRVECIKQEMNNKQVELDLESPALANALLFINSFTEDSQPDREIMQKIADCFAGDNNMLKLLLSVARSKKLNRVYLEPIEKRIYSESKMDHLLVRFEDAVNGGLMIRSVAREMLEAAYTCGIVLNDIDLHDEIGETDFTRKVMGLSTSTL